MHDGIGHMGRPPSHADTPLGRHPAPSRHPPGQTPPPMVNEWAVRILLECILALNLLHILVTASYVELHKDRNSGYAGKIIIFYSFFVIDLHLSLT